MTEFSIIVPVYNVENYLKRCLDSIKAQTYADYEVILIDDGSLVMVFLNTMIQRLNSMKIVIVHGQY